MDYIDFPRKLVYRERRSLEDFVEEHEENTLFIDNMLDNYYFSSADAKERALRCFNTAYYLCTIILQCKGRPEWNFAKYCDIAYCGEKGNTVYQSFTLSLVYIFLTNTYYEVSCKKLLKKLNDYLHNILHFLVRNNMFAKDYYFSDVCDDLQKGLPDNFLIAEEFIPRKIDKDIFKDVDGPGDWWSRLTNYYDRGEIKKIVEFLGKDEEEKHLLIELISRDAQRFYGGNDYYREMVKPIFDEMDGYIYNEYNDAVDQALMEAEELEAQINNPQQSFSDKEKQELKEKVKQLTKEKEELKAENEQLKERAKPRELTDEEQDVEMLSELESMPILKLLWYLMQLDGANVQGHGKKILAQNIMSTLSQIPFNTTKRFWKKENNNITRQEELLIMMNHWMKAIGMRFQF